ncbi:GNAT family N-acetyltransferase [Pseudooceanicola spongiae]|uniref:GNAT family N-acetyltransferase n=1 Tax=Pseudooceanicola spongiae TaxID=2613965 RepID=A0A7L9WKP4_9RHOB|nr:GNAT family N-acetyltransferase [Pseudooceanicola spongiae]QOL80287.1 GNAT family N-acetyltransferase [Pseudooceanicola spongiae]
MNGERFSHSVAFGSTGRAAPDTEATRLHSHRAYAQTLAALGAQVMALPDGTLVVQRRIGPLRLSWIPAPVRLPDLTHLRRTVLINARDAAMDQALAGSGAIKVMMPQTHAMLDLRPPEIERRAMLHQKWRNRLSVSERTMLSVTNGPFRRDPDHWLLPLETAQRLENGYSALPHSFALAWPDSRLFVARLHGTPVAAVLILLHAPGASYHIGWSGLEGRAASAHNLLLWRASGWLHARGFTQLDLGVIDTMRGAGLARFKLGAGARAEQSGHTWLYSRLTAPLGRLIS